MSSHREAPEISKDPVADNTDVYAFVSPDEPDTVTMIANYIPLQGPDGGPNFYEFGDDVLYEIHVDNNGDGMPDVTYQFRFTTKLRNTDTFLYNTGPITSLTSTELEPARSSPRSCGEDKQRHAHARRRTWPARRATSARGRRPNYPALATAAVHTLGERRQGLRRAAVGRLLRRPRLDLRPGRPAAVPEPAPDPAARRRSASTAPRS